MRKLGKRGLEKISGDAEEKIHTLYKRQKQQRLISPRNGSTPARGREKKIQNRTASVERLLGCKGGRKVLAGSRIGGPL